MKETLISVIKKLRPGWRFKVAIGLSLLFHLLLFLVHLDLFQLRPIEKPKRKAMQVTLLDKIPEDLKKIRSLKKKAAYLRKNKL